jgi:hypothetical protein
VTVSAFLPAIGKTAERKLKIEPGKTHDVDLEIVFDARRTSRAASKARGHRTAEKSGETAKSRSEPRASGAFEPCGNALFGGSLGAGSGP